MDVSAQTLREVEFREKLRGYHPDDVDEFLERVAAGIEYLQDRLRQATERAQRAESRAAESVDGDDALKRTLVLAQRTAEMAVQEARQEADRLAASARAEANAIVAQAEDMARRTIEETQGGIRAELSQLESARDRLRADITALERHLDQERMRLRASLAEALQAVEETLPPAPPAPEPRAIDIPPKRVPKVPPMPEIDPAVVAEAVAKAVPPPAPEPEPEVLDAVGEPEHHALDIDEHVAASVVSEPEPEPEPAPEVPASSAPAARPAAESSPPVDTGLGVDGLFDDLADDSMAAPAPVWAAPEVVPAEPPVAIQDAAPLVEDDEDEDPFITELRRAITDTQPLGPREEGDLSAEAADDELVHGDVLDGSRLGSLLRRRR